MKAVDLAGRFHLARARPLRFAVRRRSMGRSEQLWSLGPTTVQGLRLRVQALRLAWSRLIRLIANLSQSKTCRVPEAIRPSLQCFDAAIVSG